MGFIKHKSSWEWEKPYDYACFYCVAAGSITLTLEGRQYTAAEGDVIFLKQSDGGAKLGSAEGETAHYFLSFYYDEDTSLGIGPLVKGAAALKLFRDAEQCYHSEAYLHKLKTAQLFLGIVHHLATATAEGGERHSVDARLRAAAEYVNVYYYKKITIGDLCAVSNYSPAHLRRLFLKHYRLTPQEYIIRKKLAMVKDMLTEAPERNIDEIAEQLSFCSASYLCKLFKQHYGTPIGQYKRNGGAGGL
jgi:AraC-like DNA-binding protein